MTSDKAENSMDRYQNHDLPVTAVRPNQDNSEPIENLKVLSDPVSQINPFTPPLYRLVSHPLTQDTYKTTNAELNYDPSNSSKYPVSQPHQSQSS